MDTAEKGLLAFRVPHDYISPYLDGVYLAVNAIPNAYLVHDAHDCGYHKVEKIAGNHDLFSNLIRWDGMNRIVRTNLDSREYVMGSEDKLSMKVLQVAERHRPDIIFVVRSSVVVFAGHDAEAVVRDLGGRVEVPVVLLPDGNQARDWVSGYLDTVAALLPRIAFDNASDEQGVAIAGYLFERNEGDHRGNVEEMRRMVGSMGLTPGPVFLGGCSLAELQSGPPPAAIIDVAPGWDAARVFCRRIGARHLPASLPLGIEGTAGWVRAVGAFFGVERAAEQFIERELASLIPQLEWILPRFFFGKSAMVFADRILLGPLASLLEEIGFQITAVGSTSGSFDRPGEPEAAPCDRYPAAPRLAEDLVEFVSESRRENRLDLIIGNSFVRHMLRNAGVPFVELGYPSVGDHPLRPAPFLGFEGVRTLVERFIREIGQAQPTAGGGV